MRPRSHAVIDRRILLCGFGLLVGPLAAHAQPGGKVYRVGWIFTTAPVSHMVGPNPINPGAEGFLRGLRDLGYVEGQNLILEHRSAEGKVERYGEIISELISLKVDVIVTVGNPMTKEAKRVTNKVPIVAVGTFDPVGDGIVASLARPGGNVTGVTVHTGPELEAKRLQLLKEVLPEATRIAFLGRKVDWEGFEGASVRSAAQTLGVTLIHAQHTPTHYADAFALITREQPHALFVARAAANYVNRQLIVDFAVGHRIPGVYPVQEYIKAGGLMSYGASVPDYFRRAAGYVDKILKGAAPADLPIEQPTTFEMAINLKAAKELGITIPASVLIRADEVIE